MTRWFCPDMRLMLSQYSVPILPYRRQQDCMQLKRVPHLPLFLPALVLAGCHFITTQEATFCSEEPDSGTYVPCDCSTSPSRPECLDASSADAGDAGAELADAATDAGAPELDANPPRPLAPLSTATVSARRPTLRWELGTDGDGARVELCADRLCETMLETIDVTGDRAQPQEISARAWSSGAYGLVPGKWWAVGRLPCGSFA